MKKSIVGLLSFVLLSLTGCGADPVSIVQDGTMAGYHSLTISNAFEGSFDDADWELIETKKRKKVVSFKGEINDDTHDLLVKDAGMSLLLDYRLINPDADGSLSFVTDIFEKIRSETPKSIHKYQRMADMRKKLVQTFTNDDDLLERLESEYCPEGTPVEFQWTMASDAKTFDLTWYDKKAFPNLQLSKVLSFIYQ